jgi:DnaJ-class molecular chaperone
MKYGTYYRILGLKLSASHKEIKKRFIELSLKYHPDRCARKDPNSKARFQEILEAYKALIHLKLQKGHERHGASSTETTAFSFDSSRNFRKSSARDGSEKSHSVGSSYDSRWLSAGQKAHHESRLSGQQQEDDEKRRRSYVKGVIVAGCILLYSGWYLTKA